MTRIPSTPATTRCPDCGSARVITRDAIGRPRERCPQCQGVSECAARQPQAYVNQFALSSADVHRFPNGTCKACGGRLTRRPGPGRPPEYCEAHTPENTRYYRRARGRLRAGASA